MDFHTKLPRGKRDLALYILVVSVISVNTIAPLITFTELGFRLSVWRNVLSVMPVLWPTVVVLVLLVSKPAEFIRKLIVRPGGSFHATVMVDILCNVLLLSILLSVIGTWIGTRHIGLEPIIGFFGIWPRNFAIAFFVEAVIAQPVGRSVMVKHHAWIDQKQPELAPVLIAE